MVYLGQLIGICLLCMDKENYFIKLLKNKFIGDDGAVVDKFVYSSDLFCEGVHFKTSWMSLEQIAQKAMIVNISDSIAMNATAKYALINISIPKEYTPKMIKELATGFQKTAKKYHIKIIGGDTISDQKLCIAITIIAKSKKPLFRKGLKKGMLLAYSGKLGDSLKELKALRNKRTLHSESKFISPLLKLCFVKKAFPFLKAGLDISDGLFFELQRLSSINRVGYEFLKKIDKKVGCSGEEYEMLFAFNPKDKIKIINLGKKCRTKITIFAKAKRGKYQNRCKSHHF